MVVHSNMSDDAYRALVGDFKPGSITNVKLKNFLTFDRAEVKPGPRLNMVIGANGTGKSSILCALCLGLGGEPKLLGRADDARQFIMHEKSMAQIEITLAPFPGQTEHRICRKIDRNKGSEKSKGRGASTFYINSVKATLKEVQQLVKETYNITVDNLCTFLPQDKVGSFSGFDQQQLLKEAEKCLSGNQHLHNIHLKLIEYERELNSGDDNVDAIKSKLDGLLKERQNFERQKELMEERNEAEKMLEIYKGVKKYLLFNRKIAEVNALKEEKNRLKTEWEEATHELQPLQEREKELTEQKQELDFKFKSLDTEIQKHQGLMKKNLEKQTILEDKFEESVLQLDQKSSDKKKKIEARDVAKHRMEAVAAELQNMDSPEEIEKEFQETANAKRTAHRALAAAKKTSTDLQAKFQELETQAGHCTTRLNKLLDEKTQRKQQLFGRYAQLAKIDKWLEANRKSFRRPVWGPVAVEVSMKSNNAAAYLEQHVSNSVLTSYVVETKEDYDTMYSEVRNKLKVPINIILTKNGELQEVRRPAGDEKMAILKRDHGVIGFLDDSFTAPPAVLQALRSMAQVHRVFVGGDETQRSIDSRGLLDILASPDPTVGQERPQGSCIFASQGPSSKKYTQIISRYSGNTSSRIDDIRAASILGKGANPEAKANLEKELKDLHDQMNNLRPQIEDAERAKADLEKEGQQVGERAAKAKEKKEKYIKYKSKLAAAKAKLKDAEDDLKQDDKEEKTRLLKIIMKQISGSIGALESQASSHGQAIEATINASGTRINRDSVNYMLRNVTDDLVDKRRSFEKMKKRAVDAQKEFKAKKAEVTQFKKELEESCPMHDEDGELNALGEACQEAQEEEKEVEDMDVAIDEAEQKINSIHNDPNAIKNYEATLKDIEKVESQLEQVQGSKDSLGRKIQNELGPWKASLENSIEKINARFVEYMKQLCVTGEVRLKRGGEKGDEDIEFHRWGIEIRVSFREGVKAQVLSAQVQSGGERSVSTILFLMAMQDLMVSPFRCVDEINQGMDERNERAIFRRIVQNSTLRPEGNDLTNHCGQYFLITPKLLPSMVDMEQEAVTILLVMNGQHNFEHPTDFSVDTIVAGRRAKARPNKRASIESEEDQENLENSQGSQTTDNGRKKKRRSN